jgi:hypothetical protein
MEPYEKHSYRQKYPPRQASQPLEAVGGPLSTSKAKVSTSTRQLNAHKTPVAPPKREAQASSLRKLRDEVEQEHNDAIPERKTSPLSKEKINHVITDSQPAVTNSEFGRSTWTRAVGIIGPPEKAGLTLITNHVDTPVDPASQEFP